MDIIMLDKVPDGETWENPESEEPDYLRLFEERLEKLIPIPEDRTKETAEMFGLNEVGIYPTKLVASILYAPLGDSDIQILISNTEKYGRYYQQNHDTILEEFGIYPPNANETFPGFVVVDSNDRIYLLGSGLQRIKDLENGEARARECLSRYGITAGFRPDPSFTEPNEEGVNDPPMSIDHANLVMELVSEDLFLQIAKTYGLTNTEYLRFKLTWELPENKTRPISINS